MCVLETSYSLPLGAMLLASADQQWLSMAAAAASIYSIKYEASLVTRSLYFHLGWLEGWHETFLGWLQPPHATPVEPPLYKCIVAIGYAICIFVVFLHYFISIACQYYSHKLEYLILKPIHVAHIH